jgi:hypothetical protein
LTYLMNALATFLELAELVGDEDFRRTTRVNAACGGEAAGETLDPDAWTRQFGEPLALAAELRVAGVAPDDPQAAKAVTSVARDFAAFGRSPRHRGLPVLAGGAAGRPHQPASRALLALVTTI